MSDCKFCSGKGYTINRDMEVHKISYCNCYRGRDLQEYFEIKKDFTFAGWLSKWKKD